MTLTHRQTCPGWMQSPELQFWVQSGCLISGDHAKEAPAQSSALPSRASAETQSPEPRGPPLESGSILSVHKGEGPQPKTQHHLMIVGSSPGNPLTPLGLPLTSPRRVVTAAGKPHRWPTRPGHSTASSPDTGNKKVLGGQPSHYHRQSRGQVWQRHSPGSTRGMPPPVSQSPSPAPYLEVLTDVLNAALDKQFSSLLL